MSVRIHLHSTVLSTASHKLALKQPVSPTSAGCFDGNLGDGTALFKCSTSNFFLTAFLYEEGCRENLKIAFLISHLYKEA